jgi:hypothetical protein
MDIITLFCEIDDFFLAFEHYQAQHQLPVCHNRRISTHRVFVDYAERSKTSMGGSINQR